MYLVTCVGLRERQLENPQYGRGDVLMVQLQTEVRDPETGEFVVVERMCNKVWSPRSGLWACAEALGYPCKAGEALDTDRLMGLRCQALIKDEVGNDGAVYSRVDTLVPLPSGMAAEPLMQAMTKGEQVPWQTAPPAPSNPLSQDLYARADRLAQQGHAADELAYPPLGILTQGGNIDWAVFWQEAQQRGINRYALAGRLGLYETELDEHLRGMMPLAVIELLKPMRSEP